MITVSSNDRHYYRLRTPKTADGPSEAISVRVEDSTGEVYLAVGSGRRRMYLTADEAWTLWRCLSEAVISLGEPPEHIRTTPRQSIKRRSA